MSDEESSSLGSFDDATDIETIDFDFYYGCLRASVLFELYTFGSASIESDMDERLSDALGVAKLLSYDNASEPRVAPDIIPGEFRLDEDAATAAALFILSVSIYCKSESSRSFKYSTYASIVDILPRIRSSTSLSARSASYEGSASA